MAELLFSRSSKENTAIVSGDKRISYNELKERVYKLANGLTDLRGGKTENTAFMLYNTNEFIESMILSMMSGGKTTPVNWHLKGDDLAYIISNSDSTALIFDEGFLDKVMEIKPKLNNVKHFIIVGKEASEGMILYENLLKKSSSDKPEAPASPGGTLMYTSGTTGKPKGASWGLSDILGGGGKKLSKKERKLVIEGASVLSHGFDYYKTTNIHLAAGPLYHAAPFGFTLATYILGGTVVEMKKFLPDEALKLIEKEKVSTTFMAPTLLQRIMAVEDKDEYDVSSMKSIVCAAAPCPPDLKKEVVDYFGPVYYEFYGSSDAGVNTILRPEHYLENPEKYKSVGKVAPGNVIRLIDDNGNLCPPGVSGDLYVMNGFTIGLDYYKDLEKTKSSLREIDGDRYFDEGEVMKMDAEGFYYVVDRKKDLIISGGVNIYPAEIEQVLFKHPKVFDVAVIGVPDKDWGESVMSIIQLKDGENATEDEIKDFCKDQLSGYKKPKYIKFVDGLPRLPDGKIKKRKLKEQFME